MKVLFTRLKKLRFEIAIMVLVAVSGSLPGCGPAKTDPLAMAKPEFKEERNVVVTTLAVEGDFYKEYENNGTLQAKRKARLIISESGIIEKVLVKNGSRVRRGQLLAQIEDSQQRFNYERAVRNLEKTRLELATMLIEQGYTLSDSANVPEEVWSRAMVKSGRLDAINDKTLAQQKLADTRVVAPFSGVVADLEAKAYNESSQYKEFCLLIDDSAYEVEFSVLESELSDMEPGMEVEIMPFAYEGFRVVGRLSEINPKVEENGMVKVKAEVKNDEGKLTEGMNVKILVRKLIGRRVYVPKEAVTLRQERNVVFTHKNDTAYWNYVDLGPANSSFAVIRKGIREGDEVVIEGHFNLAHLAVVEVIDEKQ